MKAWACYWGCEIEWSILILAETRGKAKVMFLCEIGEYEFTAVNTQRQPHYDGASDKPLACMTNSDIPDGYPEFYYEEAYA